MLGRSVPLGILGCLTVGLASLSGADGATAAPFTLEGPPKVAMVLFGPKNDGGWGQAFEEARVRTEKALGIQIPVVDNIKENASAIRPAVELFIKRGYNVIIGTAFGYSDTFKELSQKYPKVAFLNGSGTTNGPNLESFYGRTYETHYLCGMAAGGVSKEGKLGFVAANPFGVVKWTVNAYELGAKQVSPKATTTVIFTGAWNDPVKERAAAEALAGEGVDVIGQHVDTPTPQIVAQEKGIYSTGHHRDMREFAPKATLCSSVWFWDRYLIPTIKKIGAGTWEPAPYGAFLSIKDGGPDIACCGPAVPKAIVEKIQAERQAIIDGKKVYAGPLSDRDGKERVPAGGVLSDADLWKMDWFVPGVISQK
ncbi:basic membrane lipoprotein [Methylorubrum populi BJ001]|jgi:basic membrane lipoprotein Med (substrate-binding protein (PBP1-ABC) superfamily)|uniref:Basic membrane lipoprotein n=1 Tax=Methylorubrum populi (strain ATCC BAA-705 / NCIMB 13946 / BJ001) TaxID=441620 RepID=B1ZES4_METPB|nr:BMP family ABC transporter substrate-binding protein [Methylorubrum populi]ACB82453.1 basic membrane lipoprotein [Methylorubrum populi BJ001]PZP70159.1 MAG: BMP family ABC transporter substrate-binding protein [Methylorubrum populi]